LADKEVYPVLINGLLMGYIEDKNVGNFINSLRIKKIK
jgi:hypothetical protein